MKKVLLLVYNLLLHIRYRRPLTQVITLNYGQSTLQDYRKIQKLHLQRGKSKLDLEFLTTLFLPEDEVCYYLETLYGSV